MKLSSILLFLAILTWADKSVAAAEAALRLRGLSDDLFGAGVQRNTQFQGLSGVVEFLRSFFSDGSLFCRLLPQIPTCSPPPCSELGEEDCESTPECTVGLQRLVFEECVTLPEFGNADCQTIDNLDECLEANPAGCVASGPIEFLQCIDAQ